MKTTGERKCLLIKSLLSAISDVIRNCVTRRRARLFAASVWLQTKKEKIAPPEKTRILLPGFASRFGDARLKRRLSTSLGADPSTSKAGCAWRNGLTATASRA